MNKSKFQSEQAANDYKAQHGLNGRAAEPIVGTSKWALNFPIEGHLHVPRGFKTLPSEADFSPIVVGREYEFHAEMQQAELPAHERMRNYTSQKVTVISGPEPKDDPETSDHFTVRASDGRVITAAKEELNGWDKALGQFFWPDGTYGPDRERTYLANEETSASRN